MITNFTNSDKYRAVIHDLIPGGAHTYSKGDDQFPIHSPAAIEYGKDAWLWDIDGNKFLDCSMALTSVSLGHAYAPVVEAVKKELEKGINFSRPAVLEKTMAETFLGLVPMHDQIKFCKNGSTATTAAVKLARAFTNRDLIAFPGDHPFYSYDDWFIGKKECNRGVSKPVANLSLTYDSSDLATLEKLFQDNPGRIACVISEPQKDPAIAQEYMDKQAKLIHEHGALFILDEMITGFKMDFPGAITKYNVDADMATWGKSIANGFSFSCLTGKNKVMELGGIRRKGEEKVFLISTTHGGETHAMAACLAVINEYRKNKVIQHNHNIGDQLIAKISEVVDKKGLKAFVRTKGNNWLFVNTFGSKESEVSMELYTVMQQEMIKRGVLYNAVFVPCYTHNAAEVDHFISAFSESLDVYAQALEQGHENFLIGEPSKPVFRKYL